MCLIKICPALFFFCWNNMCSYLWICIIWYQIALVESFCVYEISLLIGDKKYKVASDFFMHMCLRQGGWGAYWYNWQGHLFFSWWRYKNSFIKCFIKKKKFCKCVLHFFTTTSLGYFDAIFTHFINISKYFKALRL